MFILSHLCCPSKDSDDAIKEWIGKQLGEGSAVITHGRLSDTKLSRLRCELTRESHSL